jgi:D-alanyl-D-alanine carboxypeptidase/D-alanyl-D-alanine carboxypeptidase (penicillin-binding protein 5/6)
MYEGTVGVKTGFTKKSGRCLVSAAKRDGKYVIAVTLNAPSDWQDHKQMLDYGFSKIKQTNYTPKMSGYTLPVINGEKDSISVKIEPFTINSLDTMDITCDVYLPKFLYAPIKKGEILGKAVYRQGDKVLSEKELLAQCDILKTEPPKRAIEIIINNFKYILKNL